MHYIPLSLPLPFPPKCESFPTQTRRTFTIRAALPARESRPPLCINDNPYLALVNSAPVVMDTEREKSTSKNARSNTALCVKWKSLTPHSKVHGFNHIVCANKRRCALNYNMRLAAPCQAARTHGILQLRTDVPVRPALELAAWKLFLPYIFARIGLPAVGICESGRGGLSNHLAAVQQFKYWPSLLFDFPRTFDVNCTRGKLSVSTMSCKKALPLSVL